MKMIKVMDRSVLKSESNGDELFHWVNLKVDALPYKSASYYLLASNVESETATYVSIGLMSSPDGQNQVVPGTIQRALAATPRGLYAGPATATDITGAAVLSFFVSVKDGVAAAEQFAEVSLWAVLKPF